MRENLRAVGNVCELRRLCVAEQQVDLVAEAPEFFLVQRCETGEVVLSLLGHAQQLPAAVGRVDAATDESGVFSAVDQLDDGVLLELKHVRNFSDGRGTIAGEATDCEQQLMLLRREPFVPSRVLRKAEKDA
jgi:hypothetical protein